MGRPTESKIRRQRPGFLDTPRARRGGSFALVEVRVLDVFFALGFFVFWFSWTCFGRPM